MEHRVKSRLLSVSLTTEEICQLAERYHFDERELPHIKVLYEAARSISDIQVHYRLWPELKKGKRAAVCVVTLGAGVDAMQEIYTEASELSDVYILECISAGLLEKAYKEIEQLLFEETGLYVSKYEFPGSDMPVEEVREILAEFSMEAEEMTVSCNEACMMEPKKSVVYIVGLEEEKRQTCICENCTNVNCAHRRISE